MTYPGNWTHCESPTATIAAQAAGLAVVCSVDVALAPGVNRTRVAGIFCDGSTVEAVNGRIIYAIVAMRAAGGPQHPCLGYVDDLDADVSSIDPRAWIARNCYLRVSDHRLGPVVGEPLDEGIRRIRRNLDAISADRILVLVWQGYRRRSGAVGDLGDQDTAKLEALQFWSIRIAKDDPRVKGILVFAHNRVDGLITMPAALMVNQAIANSVTAPAIETVGEPPPPPRFPRVTILDTWGPRTGPAPLIVTVPVQLSGGPVTKLTVTAESKQPFEIVNPSPFHWISFRFDRPGTYAIGAQVEPGGNRTQEPRIVIVTKGEEQAMYRIPRDIIAAGLAEYRHIYKVHLLEEPNDEGLAAWMFDIWPFAIYSGGPDPGSAAGWATRLKAANLAMIKAIATARPQATLPAGAEPWPDF